MNNSTNIKVPKKYESFISEIYRDCDGYWAYCVNGYQFADMGGACHIAHEDKQSELLKVIRSLTTCDCPSCLDALNKKSELSGGIE